jgi:hypothetical protein
VAKCECDQCGQDFEVIVPNDANADGCATVFEIVDNHMDVAQLPNSRYYEEAGYDEGQHFCPKCWPEKVEELYIRDIRAGKVPEEMIEPEYRQYLPRPQLEDANPERR